MIGFGSSRVVIRQSLSSGFGRIPGALEITWRSPRGNITMSPLSRRTGGSPSAAAQPALVDFQLAIVHRTRSRLFRSLAREDLRHLLKHKRTYRPESLTARQRNILAHPSPWSRAWMATGKKLYHVVTRRWLGWSDREGAGDRQLP